MYRIFSALFLLIIAGAAFADPLNIKHMADSLTPPPTDYSVAYLGQIFGNVGGVLYGTSGQVLGKVFEVFNKGVMVVAALWLGYTTGTLALKASQEGSFLGQNRNVPVLFLRIAMGFAFIIPSPATGYSVLQDIFMKIVVSGVALADNTWDAALNYMSYGGSLYIRPSTLSNDTSLISNAFGTGATASNYGPITQVLLGEACMLQANPNNKTVEPIYVAPNLSNGTGGYVYFPGQVSPGDSPSYTTSGDKTTAPCGAVESFYNIQAASGQGGFSASNYPQKQLDQLQITSWTALRTLVEKMLPVAKGYVNGDVSDQNLNNMTFTALLSYVSLMSSYQKTFSGAGPSTLPFLDQAKTQGWIMAGRFYWDIEQANGNASAGSISSLFPKYMQPESSVESTSWTSAQNYVIGTTTTSGDGDSFFNTTPPDECDTAAGAVSHAGCIAQLWKQYVGAQQNTVGAYSGGSGFGGASWMGSIMSDIMTGLLKLVTGFGSSSGYNPIAVLMREGNVLLGIVIASWIGAIVVSIGIAAGAGICTSTSPGGVIFKGVLAWGKMIVSMLTAAMLLPGAILAYYVPLFPFAVFTFAAVGWIIMVIEGMAAAPLVCMGLTHPEGHDFLGKAEQALMLFLGIFLRPALMVIGLIASMVLSFVAFHMLLIGFTGILSDFAHSAGSPFADPFFIVISIVMVLVVFGFMTMELIEQCFKLTYQLPNNILTWIGGSRVGEEFGQMAKGMQGVIGTTNSAMTLDKQDRRDAAKEFKEDAQRVKQSKLNISDDK